jgi:hypothetical protein
MVQAGWESGDLGLLGVKLSSRNGLAKKIAMRITTNVAVSWTMMEEVLIPSISPNRMRVRSPLKELERDTMITPRDSMPTNSKPIAVSDDRRDAG